jgi:DNA-binding beta-propeller fold protein YncE
MEAQNNELRAIVQGGSKLPMELTSMRLQGQDPNALAGVVSWVASDRNGLIYLIQRGDKLDPVIVMDGKGNVLRSWGKGMYTMPHAIRIDPQGNVWTTDAASSMVYKFSPEGKKLMEIEVGGQPNPCRGNFCSTTDIAFAPNGNLFISDGYKNARILEYTPQGKKIREWGSAGDGPGQFNLPHSIQIDENGIIYVADRENGRIQRFDLQGKYLGEWSQYGKTFGLKLNKDAIWLSSIPRGPNGQPGWIFKLDRKTGKLLGYVDSTANHGMDVLPNGEVVSASPAPRQTPQWFRFR